MQQISQHLEIDRRRFASLIALAAVGGTGSAFAADKFPSKRIRLISPYTAGGIVDVAARTFTDYAAADLGQPIVVENMPGAGGAIGTTHVARSEPDGYTCVLATTGHIANALLGAKTYDPLKDFVAASLVAYGSTMAVVPGTSNINSLKDLVAAAKAQPGKLNYLSAGNGGFAHLATELFKSKTGTDIVGVTYKGLPPGVQDLAAGRLDVGLVSTGLAVSLIKSSRLKAIATMAPSRERELPDVPTFDEQGFGSSVLSSWFILAFPAATPKPVIDRVNAVLNKALADEEVKRRMASAYIIPAPPASPEQAQNVLRDDYAKIAQVIKDANIKPNA